MTGVWRDANGVERSETATRDNNAAHRHPPGRRRKLKEIREARCALSLAHVVCATSSLGDVLDMHGVSCSAAACDEAACEKGPCDSPGMSAQGFHSVTLASTL